MKRWIALLAALLLMVFVAMPTMACSSRQKPRFTVERHTSWHRTTWRSERTYRRPPVADDTSDKAGGDSQLEDGPSTEIGGGGTPK